MDRTEFIKSLASASPIVDQEHMDKIIKGSVSPEGENFRGFMNLIIVNKELSECQQEVSRHLRGKGDKMALLEEMADAWLSIRYIQEVCDISDEALNKAINVKLDRQSRRNKNHDWESKLNG